MCHRSDYEHLMNSGSGDLPKSEGKHRGKYKKSITPRQIEVLKSRFIHGSRKEGARALGISEMTARWHIERLCEHLGVETAEQAVYILYLKDLWENEA